jgi:hypothetical protein
VSIGPYWVNDDPATPITLDLYSEEDFSGYGFASITVLNDLGKPVSVIGPVPVVAETVTFSFLPDTFVTAGIHTLDVQLTGDGTVTLPPVSVVIQDADGWHSLSSARRDWRDAPEDDAQLFQFLESSKIQCLEYAPKLDGRPPVTYRQAQLLQARALWQSVVTNPDGQLDASGFQVQVYPMDRSIRALLRPLTGVPVFGA